MLFVMASPLEASPSITARNNWSIVARHGRPEFSVGQAPPYLAFKLFFSGGTVSCRARSGALPDHLMNDARPLICPHCKKRLIPWKAWELTHKKSIQCPHCSGRAIRHLDTRNWGLMFVAVVGLFVVGRNTPNPYHWPAIIGWIIFIGIVDTFTVRLYPATAK